MKNPQKNVLMGDVYMKENDAVVSVDEKVCRFCMKCFEKNRMAPMDSLKDNKLTENVLQKYLPELNISFVRDPVLCPSCLESLTNHCNLMAELLKTETKINRFYQQRNIKRECAVELSEIVKFVSVGKLESTETGVDEDLVTAEYSENDNLELLLSKEEIHIKEDPTPLEIPYNQTFECDECSYESTRKGDLTKHQLKHKPQKKYSCKLCNYKTVHKSYLKNCHVLIHADPLGT
ncbi:hypothetical protein NQ317_016220 [Molorchus minor]|uniref:C2H2-type domain-containing protein n=1 Tax=Molorchus minor TaxID=1323400 RepID=A0ABQ9J7X9_9CUCU|nr:hypothetical protein NQ317_016220 [Molorchus minor]